MNDDIGPKIQGSRSPNPTWIPIARVWVHTAHLSLNSKTSGKINYAKMKELC